MPTDLCEKNERYPLVVWNHLPIVGVKLGNRFVPRDVVGVFHPAVARHELAVCAGEMNRCPARDWVTDILQRSQRRPNTIQIYITLAVIMGTLNFSDTIAPAMYLDPTVAFIK